MALGTSTRGTYLIGSPIYVCLEYAKVFITDRRDAAKVNSMSPPDDIEKGLSVPLQPTYVLITPVHNEEKFIGRMIESITAQTVLPMHWVIVDDGSTDNTPEIVRAYAERNAFIELICLPGRSDRKPGGEGAIQQALKLVQAYPYDFLARFDSDLEFRPDYIEKKIGRAHV